jgi:hypothetical protein
VAAPVPLAAADVADRCHVMGGDILRGVPRGANAYLLTRVLMIWGDELAIQVLRRSPASGRVLVVEMVLPPASPNSIPEGVSA